MAVNEQRWQKRRRLIDERWRREAAVKAASGGESKSMSRDYTVTRRQVEAECERLRGEIVRLEDAWLVFYQEHPASYGNKLFGEAVSEAERELAALMVRLATNDFMTVRL